MDSGYLLSTSLIDIFLSIIRFPGADRQGSGPDFKKHLQKKYTYRYLSTSRHPSADRPYSRYIPGIRSGPNPAPLQPAEAKALNNSLFDIQPMNADLDLIDARDLFHGRQDGDLEIAILPFILRNG